MEYNNPNNQLLYAKVECGLNSPEVKKTMQLTQPVVSICIRPSSDVVMSTRILLKALIKVSLWVVEEANKLQIEL